MTEILQNSKYNARAIQKADFKKKIPGYNFSYPVLNTVEITNLFIDGGSVDIIIERSGLSKWSFDIEKHKLSIAQNDKLSEHVIKNEEELVEAMNNYFDEHKDELIKDNLATNMKKSNSQNGNQNAKRDKTLDEKELEAYELYKLLNGRNICTLNEYTNKLHKTPKEYLDWVKSINCLCLLDTISKKGLEALGYDIDKMQQEERTSVASYGIC